MTPDIEFQLKIVRLQLFLLREFEIIYLSVLQIHGPPIVFSPPFQFKRGEDVWRELRKTSLSIVQRALAEFRSPSASGTSEDASAKGELVAMFEKLQGEWLTTRLEACHITSKEELVHLGWLSYHRKFTAVFRLALGLSLSGGNWPRLMHLMHKFTEPQSTYESVEAYNAHRTAVDFKKREADQFLLRCGDIVNDATYNRLARPGWVTYDTGCQFIWTAVREHNDRERAFDRALGVERNEAEAEEHKLPDADDRVAQEYNRVLSMGLSRYLGGEVIEWYWATY
ncbi:hypothetical protein BDZ89DRAFT_1049368 [Hymenopellis radicata]|nr:hypothetical protein BDZ89DRAFT_1049368 [Hymenopellis radicata]